MADSSPQGRRTIAKALKELVEFGYYRVDKVRQPDGTLLSVAHVWDTPQQVEPAVTRRVSGPADAARSEGLPVKNREEEPTLPAAAHLQPAAPAEEGGREDCATNTDTDADGEVAPPAAAVLLRVIRPEPRLRLGTVESLALAPLVARWLERGCTERDLAQALLSGLPPRVHSAAALLEDRLKRKLPPVPEPVSAAVAPRRHECGECGVPVPVPGICRACAGLGSPVPALGSGYEVTAREAARVRAAMNRRSGALLPATA